MVLYTVFPFYQKFPKDKLLFNDILDQVKQLKGSKAILTRNEKEICNYILAQDANLFELIVGRRESKNKIEGLKMIINSKNFEGKKVIFITDTLQDIIEAKEVLPINQIYAVTWGFNPKDLLLEQLPAAQILEHNLDKILGIE